MVRGDVPEEVRLKPSSGRMGMTGGERWQRGQGHSRSERKLLPSGGWTGVRCHSFCVLSGPTLVTSVSLAAQGAGQFLREYGYVSLANVRPNAPPTQLSSK